MKIHSDYSVFQVVHPKGKLMIMLVQGHCSLLKVLLKHSSLRHLKKPSCSKCVVAQLRSILRTGSDLEPSNIQRTHLSLLMLQSDSVHIGGGVPLKVQLPSAVLVVNSSVDLMLVINLMSASEFLHLMKDLSGDSIDHHHVMLTPYMARLVDLQQLLVYQYLKKLMFTDIMVMIEIQELLVHYSHLIVLQK